MNKIILFAIFVFAIALFSFLYFSGESPGSPKEESSISGIPRVVPNSSEVAPEVEVIAPAPEFNLQEETESANLTLESDKATETIAIEEPQSSLSDNFFKLREKADEGDIDAAYELGQSLQLCAHQPKSLKEYNEIITNNIGMPIEDLNYWFDFCSGITEKQIKLSTLYLEKAAKKGLVQATIDLFSAAPYEVESFDENYIPQTLADEKYLKELNERRVKYVEDALKEGSFDAALSLGSSYANQQAPKAVSPTGYDLKKAIRYLHLAKLMNPNEALGVSQYLESLRLEVSVYEYESAISNAREFYRNNLADKEITSIN